MKKFCHIIEHAGRQVLILKEVDENGKPELQFRTTSNSGHLVNLKFGYKDGDWEARDKGFSAAVADEGSTWRMVMQSPGVNL